MSLEDYLKMERTNITNDVYFGIIEGDISYDDDYEYEDGDPDIVLAEIDGERSRRSL